MSLITGWCQSRQHEGCPGTVRRTQDAPLIPCPCECHGPVNDKETSTK